MKTLIFSLFFLTILLIVGCTSEKPIKSDNQIVIGIIDSIYSKVLKENRTIWLYIPNTKDTTHQKHSYPVVYLLDGDLNFYSYMGMMYHLSTAFGNSICPEMIIVGILNTNRHRDLTPTNDSTVSKTSGGGENFITFIEKELIPYIDSKYPTTSYRTLIGHSLGGLMVINTLFNHPNLFNSYIAIDPSLWWNNQKLLKQSDSLLKQKEFDNKTLFLAIANTMTMNFDMDTVKVKKDTSVTTKHIRSILQFRDILRKNPTNGLRWDWKYYQEDSHGSVPLIAEYDAVHFVFDFYKFPNKERLLNPFIKTDSALNVHFQNVSKTLGYKVLPPESFMNELGYLFLQKKLYDRASVIFKMNIDNYPKSFNTYDSMGELLMNKGDTLDAIKNYEKSLVLNPQNEIARNMIKKMKEKSHLLK